MGKFEDLTVCRGERCDDPSLTLLLTEATGTLKLQGSDDDAGVERRTFER